MAQKMSQTSLDPEQCPVCKSDRYLNANLKLLVSPCYHRMCITCIDRLFTAGPSPCPICKMTLRKSNFVQQTFEDLYVEKEVQVRKKVGKYFNKRIEDFNGDLRRYNDYLEEVEEILFNMVNGIDVAETQAKIDKFRAENKEIIAKNLTKQLQEDKALQHRLEKEKKDKQMRLELYVQQMKNEQEGREADRRDIIRLLAESDKPAEEIVASYVQKRAEEPVFALPDVVDDDDYMNMQDSVDFDYRGFDPLDDPFDEGIKVLVADSYMIDMWNEGKSEPACRGGGYSPALSHSLALKSAFGGLFLGL